MHVTYAHVCVLNVFMDVMDVMTVASFSSVLTSVSSVLRVIGRADASKGLWKKLFRTTTAHDINEATVKTQSYQS